jgi:UDP-2,3-diacylglucosamine pyrophosphatase LpxH
LGTYGCQAKELYQYLKSIKPDKLIINGDFIDIWQFKKNYFPKDHLKIIKRIITLASKGTEVIYITGNHDELLRKFANFKLGNFELVNKKFLILDTKKVWIFHGDVFDASVQHSKWIAKLGGVGYDWLIRINSISNWILQKLGREKYSFSKRIKASVKKAVKFIGDFEKTAAELAIENKYDYVICGHIHQPQIKKIVTQKGECTYLNSGDWVENLTALEYNEGEWSLYTYEKEHYKNQEVDLEETDLKEINTLLRDVVPNYFK